MPTSVLLAVLAAAGLLALAPALTRGYDDAEREAAQRAASTARVLTRPRRRRTVPGPRPIRPPRFTGLFRNPPAYASAPPAYASAPPAYASAPAAFAAPAGRRARRQSQPDQPTDRRRAGETPTRRRRPVPGHMRRRRRVLLALALLNLVELAGVLLVGPGFWIGFSVTATIMVGYLIYLRHLAVVAARRVMAARYRAAWLARKPVARRGEPERRAAQRLAAPRRPTEPKTYTAQPAPASRLGLFT